MIEVQEKLIDVVEMAAFMTGAFGDFKSESELNLVQCGYGIA